MNVKVDALGGGRVVEWGGLCWGEGRGGGGVHSFLAHEAL